MAFIPAALVAAGIAVLSLIEQPTVVTPIPVNDKLAHGLMYAVLATSLIIPLLCTPNPLTSNPLILYLSVFVGSTLYGLLMEALQRYCTLTRSGNMADLLADLVGALIGVTIVLVWRICTK